MTIVDADGRLFGRWNFVDVLVLFLLVALVPLGYAAYLLFRAPDPQVVSISPTEVIEGPNRRIEVRGLNLRPYLRVSFNSLQGRTFLFQDTTKAEVDLNEMPPGVYDVVLYDFGQERHRLPQALTVKPNLSVAPSGEVMAVGRFISLTKDTAALVRKGMTLPFPGELVDSAPPRVAVPKVFFGAALIDVPTPDKLEVPAILKLTCFMKLTAGLPECGRADFTLRPQHVLTMAEGDVGLSFQVDQVRGVEPTVDVVSSVRLVGTAQAIALAARGDAQMEFDINPLALGARITAIDAMKSPGQTERMATMTIRAQDLPGGLWNGAVFLKVGGQMVFVSERYTLVAVINSLDVQTRR
jgi:hypothetical protein